MCACFLAYTLAAYNKAMACCGGSPEDAEATRRSREIDRGLRAEKDHYRKMVKILLLGAGESGKSTFLRQIRILHGEDFDDVARREFISTIYGNVIKAIKILIEARRRLGVAWGDEASCARYVDAFAAYNNEPLDSASFNKYFEAIAKLWNDSGIQETFARRREYQIVRRKLKRRWFWRSRDRLFFSLG